MVKSIVISDLNESQLSLSLTIVNRNLSLQKNIESVFVLIENFT